LKTPTVAAWWSDPSAHAARTATRRSRGHRGFFAAERELRQLSHYLEPFFMEAPPDIQASGWRKAWQDCD